MQVSARALKWIMRLYPPLFFQRISVVRFEKDFRGADVKIKKSFLNKNYNGSIFGGAIFSATDAVYPVLFHQLLTHKGYNVKVWSHSAAIRFRKPGMTTLFFNISISDDIIEDCELVLNTVGKYRHTFPIEVFDKNGLRCASVLCKIYVRNMNIEVD